MSKPTNTSTIMLELRGAEAIVWGTSRQKDVRAVLSSAGFYWNQDRNVWLSKGTGLRTAELERRLRTAERDLQALKKYDTFRRDRDRGPQYRLTGEQQAIITTARAGANMVVEAGAGTGKTSTLVALADAMDDKRILYVAYSRPIVEEARRKFGSNVTVQTADSVAFQAVGSPYRHRLPPRPKMTSHQAAGILGARPINPNATTSLSSAQVASLAQQTVMRFAHSADDRIHAGHVPQVPTVQQPEERRLLATHVLPVARAYWDDVQDVNGKLPFEHDHYVKMWQLSRPSLPYDMILFDEAQDANPAIADALQSQQNTQLIAVGDANQAIYEWRGAVNALETWPTDHRMRLTQSFRFGPAIAEEANRWLEILGTDMRLVGSPHTESRVEPLDAPDAVLCRTNGVAVAAVMNAQNRGLSVAMAGNTRTEIEHLAKAARDLQLGLGTEHPQLIGFRNWRQVQTWTKEDDAAADLARFVRIIDKYGPDTVLKAMKGLARDEEHAELTISTAHKAKGREWATVQLAIGDWAPPAQRPGDDPDAPPIPRELARLIYVTLTRARTIVDAESALSWVHTVPHTRRTHTATHTATQQEPQADAVPRRAAHEGAAPAAPSPARGGAVADTPDHDRARPAPPGDDTAQRTAAADICAALGRKALTAEPVYDAQAEGWTVRVRDPGAPRGRRWNVIMPAPGALYPVFHGNVWHRALPGLRGGADAEKVAAAITEVVTGRPGAPAAAESPRGVGHDTNARNGQPRTGRVRAPAAPTAASTATPPGRHMDATTAQEGSHAAGAQARTATTGGQRRSRPTRADTERGTRARAPAGTPATTGRTATGPTHEPTHGATHGATTVDPADAARAAERQRLIDAHVAAVAYYREQLGTPDAAQTRAFLIVRNLSRVFGWSSPQQVGYAPRGGPDRTALHDHLRARGFTDDELIDAGLVTRDRGGAPRDVFIDRIMVPIADRNGTIVGFTGRQAPGNHHGPTWRTTTNTAIHHAGTAPEAPPDSLRQLMRALSDNAAPAHPTNEADRHATQPSQRRPAATAPPPRSPATRQGTRPATEPASNAGRRRSPTPQQPASPPPDGQSPRQPPAAAPPQSGAGTARPSRYRMAAPRPEHPIDWAALLVAARLDRAEARGDPVPSDPAEIVPVLVKQWHFEAGHAARVAARAVQIHHTRPGAQQQEQASGRAPEPAPSAVAYGGRAEGEAQAMRIDGLAGAAVEAAVQAGVSADAEPVRAMRAAWEQICASGLADGPARAADRYEALQRAAVGLDRHMATGQMAVTVRTAVWTLIADNRTHISRLRATNADTRPRPFAGRGQAEHDVTLAGDAFRAWMTSPMGRDLLRLNDTNRYRQHAGRIRAAWEAIGRGGLAEGADVAGRRYRSLGEALHRLEHAVLAEHAATGDQTRGLHRAGDLAIAAAERLDVTAAEHAAHRRGARRWAHHADPIRGLPSRTADILRHARSALGIAGASAAATAPASRQSSPSTGPAPGPPADAATRPRRGASMAARLEERRRTAGQVRQARQGR